MKSLLVALSLGAAISAQTASVHVNDPRSHGVVGDAFLSLEEAIRIINEQLPLAQLSAAELAQVTGTGTVTEILVDAQVTPTITLERLLTPLDGPPVHEHIHLEGLEHNGGAPVIDATGQDVGLYVRSNHAHLHDLVIRGGRTGIVADTTGHLHNGEVLELMHLTFQAQTQVGLKLQSAGTMTHVMLHHAHFMTQATAIAIDDRSASTGVMLMARHVEFHDTQLGVDFACDANGATSMAMIYHAHMAPGGQFLRCRRTPASTQRIMLMVVGSDIQTTNDLADIQGNSIGETLFHHHHSTFRAATGRRVAYLWPQDSRFDFHGSENTIYGDIDVSAGRLNRRLWAWNTIFRDGTITVSNQGTRPSLRWNRFENCTIRAASTNSTQLAMSSSEFVGCTLDGQAAFAPIVLDNCWLSQTGSSGAVENYTPAPSPWLAKTSSSTEYPVLGGHVDLTLDLPPGMAGVWHIGFANPEPLLTEEPWRFYAYANTIVPLPGVAVGYTTVRLFVPNVRALSRAEFHAQPVTAPYFGQTHVPAFNLPRGVFLFPQL